MELHAEQVAPVHLVCSCGKRLDTLDPDTGIEGVSHEDWAPAIMHGIPRHHDRPGSSARRRPGDPTLPGRWRWRCRRCRADVLLNQDTLTRAFLDANRQGRRDVIVGTDL